MSKVFADYLNSPIGAAHVTYPSSLAKRSFTQTLTGRDLPASLPLPGGIAAARGALIFCLVLVGTTGRAADKAVEWRTGKDFLSEWEANVGVAWSGNPLRSALNNLSRQHRLAIFLDRRIEPEQRINFNASEMPLDELSQRLAQRLHIGVCRVGPVVYFGPKGTTDLLPTAAALRRGEVAQLNSSLRARLSAERPLRWPRLAQPRELVEQLAAEAGYQVAGLEAQIPHDLWPAVDLPPLVWADRMSLVLAGFELTFRLRAEEQTIELLPIPNPLAYQNRYTVRGSVPRVVADLSSKFPRSQLRADGDRLFVSGPYEDHEAIERVLRGDRVRRNHVVPGPTVYTLNVENEPLGGVVRAIAEKLMLEIELDQAVGDRWKRRVTFKVDGVSLDELLRTALRDSGLVYQLQNGRLTIRPSPP